MFNWALKPFGRRLVSLTHIEQERAEAQKQAERLEHEREKVRKLKASLEAKIASANHAAELSLRKLRRRTERATIGGVLENLRSLDWRPGSIIDIGVADGTPGLYDVWPDAPLCLVEPSPDALPLMQQIAAKRPGVQIFNVGASNRSGELKGFRREGAPYVVFVDKYVKPSDRMNGSSFPIMTCDEIVAAAKIEPPYLLKLDTDAHELAILEGAAETLARTDLCIVEMQVFHPLRARPGPDALWRFLNDHGLVFFDIAEICYAPSGVMRMADLVFVRQDSPLYLRAFERRDKHDGIVRHAEEFARRAAAAAR